MNGQIRATTDIEPTDTQARNIKGGIVTDNKDPDKLRSGAAVVGLFKALTGLRSETE